MKKTIYLISFLLITILTLEGCGSSSKTSQNNAQNANATSNIDNNNSSPENAQQQTGNENPTNTSPNSNQQQTELSRTVYECSATLDSEKSFTDAYINQNHADIAYPDKNKYTFNPLTVRDIETLFNHAHDNDPSISQKMTLPNQATWDAFTESQKVLYLVNSERCARGIRLYEGIDPNVQEKATKPYAIFISNHESTFLTQPHTADGTTLKQRLENQGGVVLGNNATYIAENIAEFGIAYSSGYNPVYASAAKSVYGWMYLDKAEGYGHREFVLKTGFDDDSGINNQEGLISVYTSQLQIKDSQGFWTKTFTVMDGFDPRPNWDNNLAHIQKVSLYK